ncbi:MAG: aminopeptidase P N-terminal domain-containing protein, partial [Flavihumibacter sp.]
MKHELLSNRLFTDNRKRFAAAMEKNALAIFNSNDETPTNGDALYPFQQNADLYWLTGIEQEDSMLLLYPSHPDAKLREILVLLRPNELKEKW